MTKISVFTTAIAALVLAACSSADYSKTKSGITYKIVGKGSGPQVKVGQFLKVHYTQTLKGTSKDSTLGTSYGGSPTFARVDSVGPVYNAAEVFRFLHKGDSVVIVQEVDSLAKQNPILPPFIKKGDKLYLTIKVVDVLDNEDQVKAAIQQENAEQEKRDVAALDEYIKKNNIAAKKVGKGTYVLVQQVGEGPLADSGKYVSVRYRGKLLETGKEFETNIGNGRDAFTFPLGQGQVIPGWDEGLKQFAKGGKGTLYIPAFLAYGSRQGPGGKANEALIFEIELENISDKAPAPKAGPMMPPVQGQQPQKQ